MIHNFNNYCLVAPLLDTKQWLLKCPAQARHSFLPQLESNIRPNVSPVCHLSGPYLFQQILIAQPQYIAPIIRLQPAWCCQPKIPQLYHSHPPWDKTVILLLPVFVCKLPISVITCQATNLVITHKWGFSNTMTLPFCSGCKPTTHFLSW